MGAGLTSWARAYRGDPQRRRARMLARFSAELQLRPEQRPRVAAVFDAQRVKVDALRSDFQARFQDIRAATKADVRKLLDAGQQARFDALQARWEEHRRRKEGRGAWW